MSKAKHWKHPQFGMVFCNETVKTPVGRFSWPSLVTPKPGMPQADGSVGQPRYEITVCIPKDGKGVTEFLADLNFYRDEMVPIFNQKRAAKLGEIDVMGKYGDGDTADHEKYPYYKGCWIISARNSKQEFNVMDANGDDLDPAAIVGGMQGRLLIRPLVTGHGMSFKLEIVKLLKDDGVRFGGGVRDVNKLKALLDEEEELSGDESMEEPGEMEETTMDEVPEEVTPIPAPARAAPIAPSANQRFNPAAMRAQMAGQSEARAKSQATAQHVGGAKAAPKAPVAAPAAMRGKAGAIAKL